MTRVGVAVVIWVGTLVLAAASLGVMVLTWGIERPDTWGFRGFEAALAIPAGTVGVLIVRRHPRHAVGWGLLLGGALFALQFFAQEYLYASYFALPEPLPAAALVGWLNVWIGLPASFFLAVALLYFPDGRLASPAWRWVPPFAVVGAVAGSVGLSAQPREIATQMFGVPPPYDPRDLGLLATYAEPLSLTGFLMLGVVALAGALSVARRSGRAASTQRQQIKWFALVGALAGVATLPAVVVTATAGTDPSVAVVKPSQYLLLAATALVPISLGIAILRHRLFDIDVIIGRTLVYGATSALLAMVYAGSVLALGALARPLTGSGDLAVAGSTLAVVALFAPLRRRIQGAVDRRFYRSHYDAQRTVDRFALRLRDEVELDAVRAGLLGAVVDTVRPAHASLWVREARR